MTSRAFNDKLTWPLRFATFYSIGLPICLLNLSAKFICWSLLLGVNFVCFSSQSKWKLNLSICKYSIRLRVCVCVCLRGMIGSNATVQKNIYIFEVLIKTLPSYVETFRLKSICITFFFIFSTLKYYSLQQFCTFN